MEPDGFSYGFLMFDTEFLSAKGKTQSLSENRSKTASTVLLSPAKPICYCVTTY